MLLASASGVRAQAALAATRVSTDKLPPSSHLTLRPSPGTEALAIKIARVLALRSSTTVEIGSPPPPALLEAVSAGNVALEREGDAIHLVMGASLGASYEARVALLPNGEEDTRALALAIEALRDRAIEVRERQERQAQQAEQSAPAQDAEATLPSNTEPVSAPQLTAADDDVPVQTQPAAASGSALEGDPRDLGEPGKGEHAERALRVKPMLYLSMYGGASSESNSLRTGVATGGGLCVRGQCLLLAIEYPLPIGLEAGGGDIRYRYPTFSCSFYSQLVRLGRFTPAASVSLLSRVGHFERDMGIVDYQPGLDTDLAVRGTLQGAFEIVESLDVVAEAGLDYALDRFAFSNGDSIAYRGSRTSPWLQAGLRVRPE